MPSEKLLEFEESLAGFSSNTLLLQYLDLRADLNRFCKTQAPPEISEPDVLKLIADHDYPNDESSVCITCLSLLSDNHSKCCKDYITSLKDGTMSSLEMEYWISLLNNPYKTILTFPNYSKMAFFQTGIPLQLRPLVWQKLILVNQKNCQLIPDEALMIFKNFQHSYDRGISSQIKKDLTRTFPCSTFFASEDTISSLLTILNVYANYDLELGYCQGLLFLVGTLFYQLKSKEFTFHSLCKIMECEPELRSIFMPESMQVTLEKWLREFHFFFSRIDKDLANHLESFCDNRVFLFQWWLTASLIHTPNLSVNNKIVDCCLSEGWKVGIFKVSAGLLVRNKPILMSFQKGDEEVVYQHLLNESKWGNINNNITDFFGDLLPSWDLAAELGNNLTQRFNSKPNSLPNKTTSPGRTAMQLFRNLSIGSTSSISDGDDSWSLLKANWRSQSSVFSVAKDTESVNSSSSSCTGFGSDSEKNAYVSSDSEKNAFLGSVKQSELAAENKQLREIVRRAYEQLEDEDLKGEMLQFL